MIEVKNKHSASKALIAMAIVCVCLLVPLCAFAAGTFANTYTISKTGSEISNAQGSNATHVASTTQDLSAQVTSATDASDETGSAQDLIATDASSALSAHKTTAIQSTAEEDSEVLTQEPDEII